MDAGASRQLADASPFLLLLLEWTSPRSFTTVSNVQGPFSSNVLLIEAVNSRRRVARRKPPKGSSTTPLGWSESNGGGFQRLRKSSTPSTNRSPNSIPGTCADRSNADVRGRSRADGSVLLTVG